MSIHAYVDGVGLLGPGLTNWSSSVAVLRGAQPYTSSPSVLPAPLALPPAERRRAGRVIRLALQVGAEAVAASAADARTLPTVFSSSGGDGDNCHEICQALAGNDRALSPTRFHNSVHNAASGYWSIAYGCTEASTALCAHDASFGAGLLEALIILRKAPAVLLLAYDADHPSPLRATRPIPDAFGAALLLRRERGAQTMGAIAVSIGQGERAPTPLDSPSLEALRSSNPAARVLPLLSLLARGHAGEVVLDYLEQAPLTVEFTP